MTKDNKQKDDKEYLRKKYEQFARIMESDFANKLREADKGLAFPQDPEDILEYLGNLDLLELTESEKQALRVLLQKRIEKRGAKRIWENRIYSKCELDYINQTFGLDWKL